MSVLKYANRIFVFMFVHYTFVELANNFSSSVIVVYCSLVSEPKFFLNPTCTTVMYKLGLFDSEILFKLQLVQNLNNSVVQVRF